MYAIYGNIYHQYTPNVSIYTIHGSYGIWYVSEDGTSKSSICFSDIWWENCKFHSWFWDIPILMMQFNLRRNIMKHPYVSEKIQEHAGGWLFQNVSKMLDHLAGLVVLNCLTDVFQYVFPKTELQNKRNYFPDRWWSRSILISMVALWMGKCHALNTIFLGKT